MKEEERRTIINYFITAFEFAKDLYPDLKVICETPSGTVSLNIGDANIYEGMCGELVIDSE